MSRSVFSMFKNLISTRSRGDLWSLKLDFRLTNLTKAHRALAPQYAPTGVQSVLANKLVDIFNLDFSKYFINLYFCSFRFIILY